MRDRSECLQPAGDPGILSGREHERRGIEFLYNIRVLGLSEICDPGANVLCVRSLGSQGTYRRTRHLLGFAVAPVALALVTFWPVRIAIEGRDLFRYGGSDTGHVFADVFYLFVAWAIVLAAIGVRTVHGWSWARSLAAAGVATAAAASIVLGSSVL